MKKSEENTKKSTKKCKIVVDKIKKWCIIVVDDKEIARGRGKAPGRGGLRWKR